MSKTTRASSYLLLLSTVLLATAAYWGPWVDHRAAALKLSGQDLGEFVKFLPGDGLVPPRQLFYLPPLVSSLLLVLLAVETGAALPRWARLCMLVVSVPVLAGLLPPVWGHPRELFGPEYRLQGLGLLLGLAIAAAHGLVRRIPERARSAVVLCLALSALLLPQVAFWTARPLIWAAYDTVTIRLGWGVWLHLAAWTGTALVAGRLAWQSNARAP